MQMQIHLKGFKYKYKYITGNMSFDQFLNTPIAHHAGLGSIPHGIGN